MHSLVFPHLQELLCQLFKPLKAYEEEPLKLAHEHEPSSWAISDIEVTVNFLKQTSFQFPFTIAASS